MRVLVVTQKGWDGPKVAAVRKVVPLRRSDLVEEAVSLARELADRGELVAIKVATAPGARLGTSRFSGKERVVNCPGGHLMEDWRSVKASFPAISYCGVCGRRVQYKLYEHGGYYLHCREHGFFCNPIPR